eukprot:8596580-Pyramimonas_sp.AAC.1
MPSYSVRTFLASPIKYVARLTADPLQHASRCNPFRPDDNRLTRFALWGPVQSDPRYRQALKIQDKKQRLRKILAACHGKAICEGGAGEEDNDAAGGDLP